MSPFLVSSINETDTFRVAYGWKCGEKKGTYIQPAGFKGPKCGEAGYGQIISKLYSLILGKKVEVGQVRGFTEDSLVCDIYYNGKNILEYLQ